MYVAENWFLIFPRITGTGGEKIIWIIRRSKKEAMLSENILFFNFVNISRNIGCDFCCFLDKRLYLLLLLLVARAGGVRNRCKLVTFCYPLYHLIPLGTTLFCLRLFCFKKYSNILFIFVCKPFIGIHWYTLVYISKLS